MNFCHIYVCINIQDVPNPIDYDGVEFPPPRHEEIKGAMMRLKNNKAVVPDNLPDELFKTFSLSYITCHGRIM